jgi:isoquinoline 1-oxidoreductase beta subunit
MNSPWRRSTVYVGVQRAPVEGAAPDRVDDAEARKTRGYRATVRLPDGVAALADTLEGALAAKDAIQVDWTGGEPAERFDSERDLAGYRSAAGDLSRAGTTWESKGDAKSALEGADRVIAADYLSDYAYHAQLEPMAVVADVDADGKGADVWVGSQTQTRTTMTVTEVLDTEPGRVRLNMMSMGGSFGRRTALMQEYVRDALLVSNAQGRPAKVVWSREDDLKHGWFRPAAAQRLRAGLTRDGRVTGWHHRVATPSVIAYFNPVRWDQVEPHDIISMRGSESRCDQLPDLLAEHVITERRARIAPYRAIGASYTSFAAEAFVDELAEAAGADPVAFRRWLLGDNDRGHRLLDRIVEMSDWSRPRRETARGLSFAGYGPTMGVGVAEISLNREDGRIQVENFWAGVDAGLVVQPVNAEAQVEGGIVYGLSSALKETVTIREGRVQETNFSDYPILRMNEVPGITVHLEDSDGPPTGLGEVGTPMIGAAVAKAFHALTGKRLRHMPFTPGRVNAALG